MWQTYAFDIVEAVCHSTNARPSRCLDLCQFQVSTLHMLSSWNCPTRKKSNKFAPPIEMSSKFKQTMYERPKVIGMLK